MSKVSWRQFGEKVVGALQGKGVMPQKTSKISGFGGEKIVGALQGKGVMPGGSGVYSDDELRKILFGIDDGGAGHSPVKFKKREGTA